MTTTREPNPPPDDNVQRGELECPKCGENNPPGARHCGRGGAHLFVRCQACGRRTARAASHCAHCGHRLHRSFWRKWQRRLFRRNSRVAPWQVALLAVVVPVVFYLIVKIAEFSLAPLF